MNLPLFLVYNTYVLQKQQMQFFVMWRRSPNQNALTVPLSSGLPPAFSAHTWSPTPQSNPSSLSQSPPSTPQPHTSEVIGKCFTAGSAVSSPQAMKTKNTSRLSPGCFAPPIDRECFPFQSRQHPPLR